MKITAAIITFNEEANIQAACDSANWADELLVVDSNSTDNTRAIAERAGARVLVNAWPGFAVQKQLAVDQATNDWILSIDADERVSEPLKKEILILKERPTSELADGYLIPRRTSYQGRWIKGGGWYPDRQLRLFNRLRGSWKKRHIHESVEMQSTAKVEVLTGDLLHYTVKDGTHHHQMIGERYAPLAARQMWEEGKRTSPLKVAIAGPAAFVRSYILKRGLRDGFAGLTIANFAAHHAFLKHLLLWEMQERADNHPASDDSQQAGKK